MFGCARAFSPENGRLVGGRTLCALRGPGPFSGAPVASASASFFRCWGSSPVRCVGDGGRLRWSCGGSSAGLDSFLSGRAPQLASGKLQTEDAYGGTCEQRARTQEQGASMGVTAGVISGAFGPPPLRGKRALADVKGRGEKALRQAVVDFGGALRIAGPLGCCAQPGTAGSLESAQTLVRGHLQSSLSLSLSLPDSPERVVEQALIQVAAPPESQHG